MRGAVPLLVTALLCSASIAQDAATSRPEEPRFLFLPETMPYPHHKGASGRRYIVETMGAGVALLDFDGDGDLDIFLPNGAPLPGSAEAKSPNHLLENRGGGAFVDVAESAGLRDAGYAMGCAVGDFDNDGDPDLYVTAFGPNRLYRNDHGRFVDVTDIAGVGDQRWGASAAFADLDNDGWLDLYVTNYLDFSLATHQDCTLGRKVPAYCSPDAYPGVADRLYRNQGDGTFVDVGEAAGVARSDGKALGVLCFDVDRDGLLDVYLAEDGVPNRLFVNRGQFRFEDVTWSAGVGFSEDGLAQAGMGIAGADFDDDGFLDLFVTNLSGETNVLYRGGMNVLFEDATSSANLGPPSLLFTGFGTVAGDFDHDGDQDLFVANGHIIDNIREFYDYYDYAQPDHFYRNDGGRFTELSKTALVEPCAPLPSRGTAIGDLDRDGDLDLVVTACGAMPRIYWNQRLERAAPGGPAPADATWIGFELRGTRSNRDAIGSRVTLTCGGRSYSREVVGGGSYLSASDTRVHFGRRRGETISRAVVVWPRGLTQELDLSQLRWGQVHRIQEPAEEPKAPAKERE